MTAMALRRALSGSRRRVAVALVLLSIGGAVALHHAAPSEMSSMGHGICLAVLAVALVAATAAAIERLRPEAPARSLPRLVAVTVVVLAPRRAPARAGPLYLRLRVLRI